MQERWEQIYCQINGGNVPGTWDGIRDESGPEGEIGPLVEEIFSARDDLCRQLGIEPEKDAALERIVDGYERLCRVCGMLMYRYGKRDGKAAEVRPAEAGR